MELTRPYRSNSGVVTGRDDRADGALLAASVDERRLFDCFVRRLYPAIYRYLVRRVGPDLADDLAAETFEVAFRRRADFDVAQPSALPWLYGIATNAVRRHARSERRRWRAYARVAEEVVTADEYAEVDTRLSAQAHARRLASAIAGLGQGQRDVLHLVALEGFSYEETAAALGVPIGTVRSRLARAREALRRELGHDIEIAERSPLRLDEVTHE